MASSFIPKDDEIAQIRQRLAALESETARLNARLAEIAKQDPEGEGSPRDIHAPDIVTQNSPAAEKITLFRSLFRGRQVPWRSP